MTFAIELLKIGPKTILIQWPDNISELIHADICRFNSLLLHELKRSIIESVVTYNALTIYVNSMVEQKYLIKQIPTLYQQSQALKTAKLKPKIWHIPVCYDLKFGIDLERVSATCGLEIDQVIKRHTAPLYHVYFLGFLPGFPYLGGLDPKLSTNRLQTPRDCIEKGSVAIGANQTGIYPCQSPGGWNIIGRTPFNLFNIAQRQPTLIQPSDKIKFIQIEINTYYQLKEQSEGNKNND